MSVYTKQLVMKVIYMHLSIICFLVLSLFVMFLKYNHNLYDTFLRTHLFYDKCINKCSDCSFLLLQDSTYTATVCLCYK